MKMLSSIPVQASDERIYMRLGRYRHFAEIGSAQKERFAKIIAAARSRCRVAAAWEVVPVLSRCDSEVVIAGGDVFTGSALAESLGKCNQILLLAVTAGAEISASVKNAAPVETAIYDAVGSETADAAAAWVQDYVRQELRPRCLAVAERRFSPGYGGLPLSVQEIFFRRLRLAELGMRLTPSFFMIPEKSVTAIAGINSI